MLSFEYYLTFLNDLSAFVQTQETNLSLLFQSQYIRPFTHDFNA